MRMKSIVIALFAGILCVQGSRAYGNDLYCRPDFKIYYDDMSSKWDNMRDLIFKASDFKSSIHCAEKSHIIGSGSIEAVVVCPYNTQRAQLRPLLLSTLKSLIRKSPNATHIDIMIVPEDRRLANGNGLYLYSIYEAEASYYKDANPSGTKRDDGYSSLALYYGVPSPQMLKEYNALIGKPSCETFLGKKMDDINDYAPLSIFNKESFNSAKKAYLLYSNFFANTAGVNNSTNAIVIKKVSYAMGKSPKDVKKLLYEIETYYASGHNGWGQEFYKFNPSDLSAF